MNKEKEKKYLVGIDEAGRGPIAGPVSLGVFVLEKSKKNIFKNILKGVKDSKLLSEKKREYFFDIFKNLKKEKIVDFSYTLISSVFIDKYGINKAIQIALIKALKKFHLKSKNTEILLDGLLKAPEEFKNQKTIIGGDKKEKIISSASIVAKVVRDREMVKLSKKYPKYDFEKNKGYGVKKHYLAIEKYGLCKIHRRSFLKRYLSTENTL